MSSGVMSSVTEHKRVKLSEIMSSGVMSFLTENKRVKLSEVMLSGVMSSVTEHKNHVIWSHVICDLTQVSQVI